MARAISHKRATGLSTNQLAKHLGIPEPTLRRWIKGSSSSNDEGGQKTCLASRNGKGYVMSVDHLGPHSATPQPLREGHRLLRDLEIMKAKATHRETQLFLNVLGKWFAGITDPQAVVGAIEKMAHAGLRQR